MNTAIGVPVVTCRPVASSVMTPERMRASSGSRRCVVKRDEPGRRRSRSAWMSAASSGRRGGQPSTTQPIPAPWLSPNVVTRKRWPKLLCDMGPLHSGPPCAPSNGPSRRSRRISNNLSPRRVTAIAFAAKEPRAPTARQGESYAESFRRREPRRRARPFACRRLRPDGYVRRDHVRQDHGAEEADDEPSYHAQKADDEDEHEVGHDEERRDAAEDVSFFPRGRPPPCPGDGWGGGSRISVAAAKRGRLSRKATVHPQFIHGSATSPCEQPRADEPDTERGLSMLKKFAAIGLSAALALSPLAALAQTDQNAAPAAGAPAAAAPADASAKAPMKSHKAKSHKTKSHKAKKSAAPAAATPAAPAANPQ